MPRRHSVSNEVEIAVAATFRSARARSGLSGKEVAARVGISRSYLSKIETSYTPVTIGVLLQLAGVLGIPAWKIMRHIERQLAAESAVPELDPNHLAPNTQSNEREEAN